MRPQPGNQFRFRFRVVRASEAVRDDSAVAGGRQTFFSSCCSCCSCWRADVPRRPVDKNHKSYYFQLKKSAIFVRVFPVKNFVSLLCIVSSWSDFRPGRLAEVVCDKLSFREARGGSMRYIELRAGRRAGRRAAGRGAGRARGTSRGTSRRASRVASRRTSRVKRIRFAARRYDTDVILM